MFLLTRVPIPPFFWFEFATVSNPVISPVLPWELRIFPKAQLLSLSLSLLISERAEVKDVIIRNYLLDGHKIDADNKTRHPSANRSSIRSNYMQIRNENEQSVVNRKLGFCTFSLPSSNHRIRGIPLALKNPAPQRSPHIVINCLLASKAVFYVGPSIYCPSGQLILQTHTRNTGMEN